MKKVLVAVVMATVLTTAVFAQRGRPGGPPAGIMPGAGGQQGMPGMQGRQGRPERDPGAALKAALGLTDAQLEAIKALMTTRQTRAQAIHTEIEQGRQALDAQLDAASPNPTTVGQAAIALRASQNKLAAERDWFITELKKLLTGTQQQTLDSLIAADPRLPLLGLGGPGGPGEGRGGPGGRGRGPR